MKKTLIACMSAFLMLSPFSQTTVSAQSDKPFNPNDFSTYGLGAKEEKRRLDVPIYKPQKQISVLPTQVDLRPYFPAIRNQGPFATAVPFAVTGLREFYTVLNTPGNKGTDTTYLSPLYNYFPNSPYQGMFLYDSLSKLQYQGVSTESERPFSADKSNEAQFYNPLTEDQNKSAKSYGTYGFAVIPRDSNMVHTIKHAVANKTPVLVTIAVTPNFDATPNTGVVPPVQDVRNRGYHVVLVVGYDEAKQQFIVRNTWGDKFGDKGYLYFDYGTLMQMSVDNSYVLQGTSTQHPPQGVNFTVNKQKGGKVWFDVSAINASKFEFYKDGQLVQTYSGQQIIDSLKKGEKHSYYVRAINETGSTKSYSIDVEYKDEKKPGWE